jgi:hypothetical protein
MSQYYRGRRKRNLYDPNSTKPFKLSRSRIDLFIQCPRCFYIDRRLGLDRPPGFPFALNSAVDTLLKKEFDECRERGIQHPIQIEHGLDFRPAARDELDQWRQNFTGVQFLHEPTNLLIFGAIDDLWIDSAGTYAVVDYKATAKSGSITALDQPWHTAYKRQMEIYQWLIRRNSLLVSDIGYFLYCNGNAEADAFNNQLTFDLTLIEYNGCDDWIDSKLIEIHECLNASTIPNHTIDCDQCLYNSTLKETVGS